MPRKTTTTPSGGNSRTGSKTTAKKTTHTAKAKKTPTTRAKASARPVTRITVKYDVGFKNSLFLRGNGLNLSWGKGIPLKNTGKDEWVWECRKPFAHGEFKVLINDDRFEVGNNHPVTCGTSIQYTPNFGF